MIMGQPPEPLRGTALRAAVREIVRRNLTPPLPEPPVEPYRERTKRPYHRTVDKEKAAQLRQKTAEKYFALRPPGCEVRKEIAERLKVTPNYLSNKLSKKGIKPVEKTGCIAWYSLETLRAAGILSVAIMALLPAAAGAQQVQVMPALCFPAGQQLPPTGRPS